jgi:hypothetical protein
MRIKVGGWHMVKPSEIGLRRAAMNGEGLNAFSTLLQTKSDVDG